MASMSSSSGASSTIPPELRSAYTSSFEDGSSQTMAFTVMFAGGGYTDSLSFFGVHRTAVAESHLAIMSGTGKSANAKGFAKVKTFPGGGTRPMGSISSSSFSSVGRKKKIVKLQFQKLGHTRIVAWRERDLGFIDLKD